MTREPLDVWLYGTRIATLAEAPRQRLSLIEWSELSKDMTPEERADLPSRPQEASLPDKTEGA